MGCIAQVLQSPATVTVEPQGDNGCCCNNIITPVDDIYVAMKKINVTILRGTVFCASDSSAPVEGAIVVATDGNDFVGITNEYGEYSICVPTPPHTNTDTDTDTGTEFEVQAYCCCSCNGGLCEDAPCTCGCNGE